MPSVLRLVALAGVVGLGCRFLAGLTVVEEVVEGGVVGVGAGAGSAGGGVGVVEVEPVAAGVASALVGAGVGQGCGQEPVGGVAPGGVLRVGVVLVGVVLVGEVFVAALVEVGAFSSVPAWVQCAFGTPARRKIPRFLVPAGPLLTRCCGPASHSRTGRKI